MKEKQKKPFKIPHTYVILGIIIVIMAILTWIVPAGEFDRVVDEASGRTLVVPGSYHEVEGNPVGLFRLLTLVQEAMIDSSGIIFFIFFAYAFVYMQMKCGAFDAAVGAMLRKLHEHKMFIIPLFMLIFGLCGSTFGMTEETFGFIPVFMGIAVALRYDALVGGAMVYVGVITGFASATVNPFTIGVAHTIAELPMFSGLWFRCIVFAVFMCVSMWYVMRYAKKVQKEPRLSIVKDVELSAEGLSEEELMKTEFTVKHKISMLLFLITVILIMFGAIKLGWYINEIAGLFLGMMILVGLIQGYNFSEIAQIFIEACRDIMFGALVCGVAKTILLVMQDGMIMDTFTNAIVGIADTNNKYLSAFMMLITQNLLNFFIPSGSGQAVTSMPIMVPIADMVELPRQVAVLAYQFGDGFSNMIWPTSVATWCGMMKLPMDKWYKFVLPLGGILLALETVFIMIATAINYGPF